MFFSQSWLSYWKLSHFNIERIVMKSGETHRTPLSNGRVHAICLINMMKIIFSIHSTSTTTMRLQIASNMRMEKRLHQITLASTTIPPPENAWCIKKGCGRIRDVDETPLCYIPCGCSVRIWFQWKLPFATCSTWDIYNAVCVLSTWFV